MAQAVEAHYGSYFSQFPYLVRVPVPRVSVTATLEAMHSWAWQVARQEYAASPFRDFSDPWQPSGAFSWHFFSADAAQEFAARFSGKIIEKR